MTYFYWSWDSPRDKSYPRAGQSGVHFAVWRMKYFGRVDESQRAGSVLVASQYLGFGLKRAFL
jgi:hypothetical protein